MFAQMPSIGSPDLWSQFGLAGLVIFALFVGFFGLVFCVMKTQSGRDDKHQEFLDKLLEKHVNERSEWRKDADAKTVQYTQSLDRLTTASVAVIDRVGDEVKELTRLIQHR